MDAEDDAAPERGWLLFRLAMLRRYADPARGLHYLDDAGIQAVRDQDASLAALVRFYRGHLRAFTEDFRGGIPEMEAGVAAIGALSPPDYARLAQRQAALGYTLGTGRSTLVLWFATVGRYEAARALGASVIAETATDAVHPDTYIGLMYSHAALGLPTAASEAFRMARDRFRAADHWSQVHLITLNYLMLVALAYAADDVPERERLAAESESALTQASGQVLDPLPARLARLPLLLIEGAWDDIPTLATAVAGHAGQIALIAANFHAQLARARGDRSLTWRLVHDALPRGAGTAPGDARFQPAIAMIAVGTALALDEGDLPVAHEWLAAYDRWLTWSGATRERAAGMLLRARYDWQAGDAEAAYAQARDALINAAAPRQPLGLLGAHRLLGELDIATGDYAVAATHLGEALMLADACAAPYERALTLLAQAELHATTGARAEAMASLGAARIICQSLGARPALARAATLTAALDAGEAGENGVLLPAAPLSHVTVAITPDDLTAREREVLRLIAAGMSNREIAAALFISERTVGRHITNLYTKIGAHGKADATVYAVRHHLAESETG